MCVYVQYNTRVSTCNFHLFLYVCCVVFCFNCTVHYNNIINNPYYYFCHIPLKRSKCMYFVQ